jgi:hypothetical protein
MAGKQNPPPTYHRGLAKIDFVLLLASLGPSVRAASIMALYDGYLSEHRALLVDFDAQSLFTSDTSPVTQPVERRLTSTSPRAVHTYIESLKGHFAKHDIASKVYQLQQMSDTCQWSDECVQVWESINRLLSEARRSSERKCKAKRSGLFPWSPALQEARCRLFYWRLRMSAHTCNKVNVNTLTKLTIHLKISLTDQEPKSGLTLWKNIQRSRRAFTKAKENAQNLREEHLRERASFLAATQAMSEKAAAAAIAARAHSSQQF